MLVRCRFSQHKSDPTHSMGVKIFKTEKTLEIHLVRLTEVCGKVLSGKYAYKSVKTTKTAVCLQTKAILYYLYGF